MHCLLDILARYMHVTYIFEHIAWSKVTIPISIPVAIETWSLLTFVVAHFMHVTCMFVACYVHVCYRPNTCMLHAVSNMNAHVMCMSQCMPHACSMQGKRPKSLHVAWNMHVQSNQDMQITGYMFPLSFCMEHACYMHNISSRGVII